MGNIVLFGHSSFVRKYGGNFNTVFATIPLLQAGDKAYLYEQSADGNYLMYEYRVVITNEVDPEETSVMLPGMGANMTLITCTPHGTIRNRRVVKLKLAEELAHQESYIKLSQHIDVSKRASIQKHLTDIENDESLTQEQKNLKLQDLRSTLNTLEHTTHQAQAASLIDYTRSEVLDIYDGGRNAQQL